ncbi:MAG: ferredoxin [Bacteroidota bacterium]
MTQTGLSTNLPGRYFVSDECDGCAYCALVAPDNFDFDKLTNTYYVARQPQTTDEIGLVSEVMEDCPVDAIQERNN